MKILFKIFNIISSKVIYIKYIKEKLINLVNFSLFFFKKKKEEEEEREVNSLIKVY
jgi:hypothetical protein